MTIYFKKLFWLEKEMTELEALDMAIFLYWHSRCQAGVIERINSRFIWIQFTERDLNI